MLSALLYIILLLWVSGKILFRLFSYHTLIIFFWTEMHEENSDLRC